MEGDHYAVMQYDFRIIPSKYVHAFSVPIFYFIILYFSSYFVDKCGVMQQYYFEASLFSTPLYVACIWPGDKLK